MHIEVHTLQIRDITSEAACMIESEVYLKNMIFCTNIFLLIKMKMS